MVAVPLVEPLDQRQGGHFGNDPGGQPLERLGVVAPDHELAAQLREQVLDALPGFPQHWAERSEIELVAAHGRFQADGGGVKKVVLPLAAQIALVAHQDAMAKLRLQVVQVMDVMFGCL